MAPMKHLIIGFAASLCVLCVLPEEGAAQYHGVTHHRVSRRAARVRRPGWNQPSQQGVPELDPRAAGAAIALLLGGLAVVRASSTRVSMVDAA